MLPVHSDQYSSTGVQAFQEELERKNLQIMASQTFTQNSKDVSSKVKTVVDAGCKVRRNRMRKEEGRNESGTPERRSSINGWTRGTWHYYSSTHTHTHTPHYTAR